MSEKRIAVRLIGGPQDGLSAPIENEHQLVIVIPLTGFAEGDKAVYLRDGVNRHLYRFSHWLPREKKEDKKP